MDNAQKEMDNAQTKFIKLIKELHSSNKPEDKFMDIAAYLMNELCIITGDNSYRIMECEFYYNSINHPDPYVHAVDDKKDNKYAELKQYKTGEWYFHDYGDGLDITIGGENICGGILIRGIYKLNNIKQENHPYYVGPFNACKELFNNIGGIFENNNSIKLSAKKLKGEKIIISRRIGIGLDSKENNIDKYHEKHYRFIVADPIYINHKKFRDRVYIEKNKL